MDPARTCMIGDTLGSTVLCVHVLIFLAGCPLILHLERTTVYKLCWSSLEILAESTIKPIMEVTLQTIHLRPSQRWYLTKD